MSESPTSARLPSWAILPLPEALTAAEVCARAVKSGVSAGLAADGSIQFPGGFLGWVDPRPLPRHLLDTSVSEQPLSGGACCLHLSGGTNELERQSHDQAPAIRKMTAEMRERFDAIATPPGQEPRIISTAAAKVERLTQLIRGLLPLAEGLVLPCANDMAFSASEFLEQSEEYLEGGYHFPLYCFVKVRSDADGAYACTTGMFLFALPDLALPLGSTIDPTGAAQMLGELQREMVAEGWWPEDGATFDTSLGTVKLERLGGVVFATPTEVALEAGAVAAARYRFARERRFDEDGVPGILHRVRGPGLIVDHHLNRRGSYAITNGLGLMPQAGGTTAEENLRMELVLLSDQVGTWATGWIDWIVTAIRSHDGSHPFRPFDRLALEEPVQGIAGCILWPRGSPSPGIGGEPVHTWVMVPLLTEELAAFRAQRGAQEALLKERSTQGDLPTLYERWARVIPRR